MCIYFNYCTRSCKTKKTHYGHWNYVANYVKEIRQKRNSRLNCDLFLKTINRLDNELLVKSILEDFLDAF